MNIQFLGTAAYEAIPAFFCNCKVCTQARKNGGKDLRTRSQALIDGELLVDFPADTLAHCFAYGVDLANIEHCLITHTHSDHLYISDIKTRMPGFSNLDSSKPFNLYGSFGAMQSIDSEIAGVEVIKTHPMELYKEYTVGRFKVTALKGYHDEKSYPVFYIIENKEGKRLMYGNDTNYFYDEVWQYLENNPKKLDFVALDCTSANAPEMTYIGHMNLKDNVKVKNRLIELGCADETTIFCSNHFSHNGDDVLYDTFSKYAEKEGFLTSYDGMIAEF